MIVPVSTTRQPGKKGPHVLRTAILSFLAAPEHAGKAWCAATIIAQVERLGTPPPWEVLVRSRRRGITKALVRLAEDRQIKKVKPPKGRPNGARGPVGQYYRLNARKAATIIGIMNITSGLVREAIDATVKATMPAGISETKRESIYQSILTRHLFPAWRDLDEIQKTNTYRSRARPLPIDEGVSPHSFARWKGRREK